MSAPRRILGIDPGSRITGFGIVDADGDRLRYVDCGVIAAGVGDFPDRLRVIFRELAELISRHRPEETAVEKVFMSRNAESALKLGQARGAAICAAVQAGLPVGEYAATRIKQAVVGRGQADKRQVQHMVCALLGLRERVKADAADALAVAVCHAHESRTAARLRAYGVES